jgi:hypothetical protein
MKSKQHEAVNTWWEGVPGERYWLDVTCLERNELILASPRGEGPAASSWVHRLVTHVKGGDVVFHYDPVQEAIVACSLSQGSIKKQQVSWPQECNGNGTVIRPLPSWGIGLQQFTELEAAVPLHQIAKTQWGLFPQLRALEDAVGDPLYYPFEMGSREATRPLSGYVFKLPAVFVRAFPALAGAEQRVAAPAVARIPARASTEAFPAWRGQRTA